MTKQHSCAIDFSKQMKSSVVAISPSIVQRRLESYTPSPSPVKQDAIKAQEEADVRRQLQYDSTKEKLQQNEQKRQKALLKIQQEQQRKKELFLQQQQQVALRLEEQKEKQRQQLKQSNQKWTGVLEQYSIDQAQEKEFARRLLEEKVEAAAKRREYHQAQMLHKVAQNDAKRAKALQRKEAEIARNA